MGHLVSTPHSTTTDPHRPLSHPIDPATDPHIRPTHISLPPPPTFGAWSLATASNDLHEPESPFVADLPSPNLNFYTAPSTPHADIPTAPPSSPPLSPALDSHHSPPVDGELAADVANELTLDDANFNALEKIWLFCRSKTAFHRVYIIRALTTLLDEVEPSEAVRFVLPLVSALATDPDESVKVALAAELLHIIWWFFTKCRVVSETADLVNGANFDPPFISVQAFTPVLGTLLLNHDSLIGGAARYAVVHLLSRMKKIDDIDTALKHSECKDPPPPPVDEDDDTELDPLNFGPEERALFQHEIIQQVVIGMGKLDLIDELDESLQEESGNWEASPSQSSASQNITSERGQSFSSTESDNDANNPYFPSYPSSNESDSHTPPSSHGSQNSTPTDESPSSPDNHSPNGDSARPPKALIHSHDCLAISIPQTIQTNAVIVASGQSPPPTQSPPPEAAIDPPPISEVPIASTTYQALSQYSGDNSWSSSYESRPAGEDDIGLFEDEGDGQASVGRLSSMSLMAAVTASGSIRNDIQEAFVKEVERVSKDPVFWVRREAAFALGALAKVVPQELVLCTLLPMLETLSSDAYPDVRHSALFALPAVLGRLPPPKRRAVALQSIIPLASDDSGDVRTGVLESLGEVLHTFYEEEEGPPQELLHLFIGRPGDLKQQTPDPMEFVLFPPDPISSKATPSDPMEAFYTNPDRAHICAFNYPAVALTLGRARWGELRGPYFEMATSLDPKVRKTIAASLGEMAKIIGQPHTELDLVPVWWDSINFNDTDVRIKAIECLEAFFATLLPSSPAALLAGLEDIWDAGGFSGWREREAITKALPSYLNNLGVSVSTTLRGLLRRALEDSVAAVRDIAIAALPKVRSTLLLHPTILSALQSDLHKFAISQLHRRRMTFVACQQSIVESASSPMDLDDEFWDPIDKLATDPTVGVRIGIARLLRCVSVIYYQLMLPIGGRILALVQQLSRDESREVQSYVLELSPPPEDPSSPSSENHSNKRVINRPRRRIQDPTTFSRPPGPPIRIPWASGIESPWHNKNGGRSRQ